MLKGLSYLLVSLKVTVYFNKPLTAPIQYPLCVSVYVKTKILHICVYCSVLQGIPGGFSTYYEKLKCLTKT